MIAARARSSCRLPPPPSLVRQPRQGPAGLVRPSTPLTSSTGRLRPGRQAPQPGPTRRNSARQALPPAAAAPRSPLARGGPSPRAAGGAGCPAPRPCPAAARAGGWGGPAWWSSPQWRPERPGWRGVPGRNWWEMGSGGGPA